MLEGPQLCRVSIRLDDDAPIALGRSPWRNRRISYIAGGTISGERLSGRVRPGGGDWAEGGSDGSGDALTLVDVRAIWDTDDGAAIYVAYQGRLIIPAAVLPDFRDPAKVAALPLDAYHFRIAATFEVADPRYAWLNRIVAVGHGQRTAAGVDYDLWEVR